MTSYSHQGSHTETFQEVGHVESGGRSQSQIASLFNQMDTEYDEIHDLWYSWLFSRLHLLLCNSIVRRFPDPGVDCIDVGCGTGFQSALMSRLGHSVYSLDIAANLIKTASMKSSSTDFSSPIFTPHFLFADRLAAQLNESMLQYRGDAAVGKISYFVADAVALPLNRDSADIINCSGSTLNFVDDYPTALAEMHRVTRKGGMLFLEIDNRFNFDLIWSLVDSLTGGHLGYDQSLGESWQCISAPIDRHVTINYPLSGHSGTTVLPMWLFSLGQLKRQLSRIGFVVEEIHAIHSLTNILPSTILDSASPSHKTAAAFEILSRADARLGSMPIVRGFGCSTVIIAKKA